LLSDKNKELAEQLVDIRIEEERKQGKFTLFQEVPSQKINLVEKISDKKEIQFLSQSTTGLEENNQVIVKKNKWYFGFGLGSSNTGLYKVDLSDYPTMSYTNYQNKSTANKIYLGYKYSEESSLELYYAKLGVSNYSISTGWYATNKAVSYGLSGKYHPIEILNTRPFFRYGIQKISSVETGRTTYSNYSEINASSNSRALLGVGVDYSINQLLTLSVEIEKYGRTGTTVVDVSKPIRIDPRVVYFSANYSF
jgi:outer membrane protein W